jgi:Golgi phosphoprotein 3
MPEELLLLMLDDRTGRLHDSVGPGGDFALAGAVLAELSLAGRIDSDLRRLWVADATPTGDALLDGALARIAADAAPRDSRHWIALLGADAEDLREVLFQRLVAKGVLRREQGRFLWVFPERRYPAVSGREEREVKARLLGVLFDDDIPEPRDALLIGLCRAASLFGTILAPAELERLQPRIAQVADLEELNRSLAEAVRVVFAQIARHAPMV